MSWKLARTGLEEPVLGRKLAQRRLFTPAPPVHGGAVQPQFILAALVFKTGEP